MSGGSGGGMESYLPMALALGATVATGGAAAPMLGEAILGEGVAGAGLLGSGLIGAGTGGLSAALTGGNIGRSALMGGLGGAATAGIMDGLGGSAPLTGPEAANVGVDVAPTYTTPPVQAEPDIAMGNLKAEFDPNAYGSEVGTNPANAAKNVNFIPGTNAPGTPIPSSAGSTASMNPYLKYGALGLGGLALMQGLTQQPTITPQSTQGVPAGLDFKFNRNTYQPAVAPYYNGIATNYPQTPYAQQMRGYADGGTVEQMSRENATGGNQMFPQSGLGGLTGTNRFQNATNTPMSTDMLEPTDAITDPYTGQMKFAVGGRTPTMPTQDTANTQQGAYDLNTIRQYVEAGKTVEGYKQLSILASRGDDNAVEALNNLKNQAPGTAYEAPVQAAQGGIMGYAKGGNLGSYSDGGRMLKGPGDGMSDDIPAKIGKHQPARLADGEFVVPADVVSGLGNGSTDAGAKQLYAMMDKVRKARTGRKAQGKQIKPEKYLPA